MPQGPPNQAVQKATTDKPASSAQTEAPGTTATDKATIGKSAMNSDYKTKLAGLPNVIVSNLSSACIPETVNLKNPDCFVEDVTRNADGTTSGNIVPHCDRAHATLPCWRLEVKRQCRGTSPQGIGLTIDRGPAGGTAEYHCISFVC